MGGERRPEPPRLRRRPEETVLKLRKSHPDRSDDGRPAAERAGLDPEWIRHVTLRQAAGSLEE
ncbi:MAG TPA: hypothetical protein VFS03_10500, partial [Microvirga sp.]|nr:hypothetical protein [Microvirga sp.]